MKSVIQYLIHAVVMFFCYIGFHKYRLREIHYTEKPIGSTANAVIISHCSRCGNGKIIDGEKPTQLIVSTKYS